MSSVQSWETTTKSLEDTTKLATSIGSKLRGGEIIELISDLGGGKTAFVRGLAQGMGSSDKVASPSFTISRQYKANDLTLYHFDFYRLSSPGVIGHELAEIVGDPKAVVAVEWATIVEEVLPATKLTLRITATGEHTRELSFHYPKELAYLIEKDT